MTVANNAPSDCDSPFQTLLPLEEALDALLQTAQPLSAREQVPIADALGRILATDLSSTIDVPPADNSAMDGYALNSADCSGNSDTAYRVSQRIPAGEAPEALEVGSVARIFTGAQIPAGADTVVMQEMTSLDENGHVAFQGAIRTGENIRRRGEDITSGQVILQAGKRLLPQDVGLAASVGIASVEVFRQLRVATFFTGDELVQPGQPCKTGQIFNSNQYVLNGLLEQLGCEVISFGITPDSREATLEVLEKAAVSADLVLTSGGVSVGEEDHVKSAIETLGSINFWRVAIKPGKPVAFGRIDGTPVIALPGNPVSVFTTFCLLARPFVLAMQGRKSAMPRAYRVTAGFDWNKAGIRREFARARLESNSHGQLHAILFPNQGSGVLSSTSWASGLVEIPENQTVTAGDSVNYYPISEFIS